MAQFWGQTGWKIAYGVIVATAIAMLVGIFA